MAVTDAMLRTLRIRSTVIFNKLLRFGWTDGAGRSKQWHEHQRPNHDEYIYNEPREPRVRRNQQHKGGKR